METIDEELKNADVLFGTIKSNELKELHFSPKTYKRLLSFGITTIDKALDLVMENFDSIPSMPKSMIKEIIAKVSSFLALDDAAPYVDELIAKRKNI